MPKAKKVAKVAKVTKLDPELTRFREAATKYREADEKVKLFEKQRAEVQPFVKQFVGERGEIPVKAKSTQFVDEGVKWMLVPGRTIYDEPAGIEGVKLLAKAARGSAKEALAACIVTREALDAGAFARCKELGLIPENIVAAYEKERVFSLRYNYTDKKRCASCDAVVQRDQKFCHECGTPQ